MQRIESCESTITDADLPVFFCLGDRVRRVGTGVTGTVRYVGPMMHACAKSTATTSSSTDATTNSGDATTASTDATTTSSPTGTSEPPLYVGVEWDKPGAGKNDGSVEGHRYFSCAPGKGSLLLPKNVLKGISLADALERRYGSSTVRQEQGAAASAEAAARTQTRPLQLGPALGKRDENGAFTKVVSCDCTANEQMGLVCVAGGPGGEALGRLFPNLSMLSLAGTLIASWHEVALICGVLPLLCHLDLSRNPALGNPTESGAVASPLLSSTTAAAATAAAAAAAAAAAIPVISTTVTELRLSDMALLTPRCVEFVLDSFPNLEALFAARSNISLAGSAKEHLPISWVDVEQSTATAAPASSSSSTSPSSKLSYLNVEGNPLQSLDDVARLIGEARCQCLSALNVSATQISDALPLPPVDPATVTPPTPAARSPAARSSTDTSPQHQRVASSPNAGGAASANGASAAAASSSLGDSSHSGSSQCASSSSGAGGGGGGGGWAQPQPLFPALKSLYLSHVPVTSWFAWSRILHRAAYAERLADVHFSTVDFDAAADDDRTETASCLSSEGHCFLPEDFRDRRRLSVAFMPASVKKYNRSEISQVERSSALTRSVLTFAELVHDASKTRASEMHPQPIDAQKLGQLPHHLRRVVVAEYNKMLRLAEGTLAAAVEGVSEDGGGGADLGAGDGVPGGPGFIYRPPQGPRRFENEIPVSLFAVFPADEIHRGRLLDAGFSSVIGIPRPEGHADDEDDEDDEETRQKLKARIPLTVDVRWETQQLDAAVRGVLGLDKPPQDRTKVAIWHLDRELFQNPGAVAAKLHLKELRRPWEKLHTLKVQRDDHIIALVGP